MRLRRQAVVFVLAFTLAAPWVAAAQPRPEIRDRAEHRILSISEFLSHAWSLLTSLWETAGSHLDPLGRPVQPTTDEGHGMDPLG
jgi:hypothetical protein